MADNHINDTDTVRGPLSGLRVLELGHFVAAPFCTRVLADLGAEVIKVESPGRGDPVRAWGEHVDGRSLWWSVHGRSKYCVTLNMKKPEGVDLAKKLIAWSDGIVENFKPGQIEKFGIGPDVIEEINPGCPLARISGYGQTGPGRDRSSFGVIGEAVGGLRYLTAFPPEVSDLPPVRTGVSIGDSITGLYAAIGLLAALWEKGQTRAKEQRGRVIDAALTESVFSMLEGCLPEYGKLGKIRRPQGSRLATATPSSAYPCNDGNWIIIGANSEPLFQRLSDLMGMPDLPKDPRFCGNQERCANVEVLDGMINDWTRTMDIDTAERLLAGADIPSTRAYTIADCAADTQFLDRRMVRTVDDPLLGEMLHPGIVPRFDGADGEIAWTGPAVGAHNEAVYGDMLGLSATELADLKDKGVI